MISHKQTNPFAHSLDRRVPCDGHAVLLSECKCVHQAQFPKPQKYHYQNQNWEKSRENDFEHKASTSSARVESSTPIYIYKYKSIGWRARGLVWILRRSIHCTASTITLFWDSRENEGNVKLSVSNCFRACVTWKVWALWGKTDNINTTSQSHDNTEQHCRGIASNTSHKCHYTLVRRRYHCGELFEEE